MKNKLIYLCLIVLLIGCATNKTKRQSNTQKIFTYLDNNKCSQQNIEQYLLSSGQFKSSGKTGRLNMFQSLYSLGETILVNTYDGNGGFLLVSEQPSIYNFINKNGSFVRTSTDNKGFTWITYKLNNSQYMLKKDESLDAYNKIYYLYAIRGFCE